METASLIAIVVVYYNSQYSNKTSNEQESHNGPICGGYFEVSLRVTLFLCRSLTSYYAGQFVFKFQHRPLLIDKLINFALRYTSSLSMDRTFFFFFFRKFDSAEDPAKCQRARERVPLSSTQRPLRLGWSINPQSFIHRRVRQV